MLRGMHVLRVRIHRPGYAADRLLTVLAERRDAQIVGRQPGVRGLLAWEAGEEEFLDDVEKLLDDVESERSRVLAAVEHDLDRIARELEVGDWRATVGVD
jgi:hypothetical protein